MKRKIMPLLFGIVTILTMTNCELLNAKLVFYTDVSGQCVNAMSSGTSTEWWKDSSKGSLSGATLKFYQQKDDGMYESSPSTSTTVDSTGSYSANEISMGKYKVTGNKDGWVFVPRYVNISGKSMKLPSLIAYPNQGNSTLVIVLSWEDTNLDLDGVLGIDGTSYVGYDSGYNRVDTTGNIRLVRDVNKKTEKSIPRVETIIIKAGILGNFNELNYYVKSFNGKGTLTGVDDGSSSIAFSNSQVDIMFGKEHFGGWATPWNTGESTLKIIKIVQDGRSFTIASANRAKRMRNIGE